MTHRNRLDLYFEILSLASTPSKKTHIMYKTNLSWKSLNKYFSELVELGLIKEYNGTYVTTEKGLRYIPAYQKLVKLLEPNKPVPFIRR